MSAAHVIAVVKRRH